MAAGVSERALHHGWLFDDNYFDRLVLFLMHFQAFVKLCTARTGQLLRLKSLGAYCGISSFAAKLWLTVLETSCIVSLLPPDHHDFGKRLVKAPKLYFCDVGLVKWLLGISDTATLVTHAARGALFENDVLSERLKQRLNAEKPRDLYFWCDRTGNEVELLVEFAQGVQALEINLGSTFASDWTNGLKKMAATPEPLSH